MAAYLYHTIVPAQLSIQHFIQESIDVYFFLSLIIILGLAVLALHLLRNPDRTGRSYPFHCMVFHCSPSCSSFFPEYALSGE